MVEQALIRTELETGNHPVSGGSEVEPEYRAFLARLHPDPAELARALAGAGIAEEDLKKELLWELTLTRFVGMRFRPGVQVTAEEIQQYFDNVVAPLARAAHPGAPVELNDYREDIEVKLTGERADREMDKWLKEARGARRWSSTRRRSNEPAPPAVANFGGAGRVSRWWRSARRCSSCTDSWFRDQVRRRMVRAVEDSTGGRVEIGVVPVRLDAHARGSAGLRHPWPGAGG